VYVLARIYGCKPTPSTQQPRHPVTNSPLSGELFSESIKHFSESIGLFLEFTGLFSAFVGIFFINPNHPATHRHHSEFIELFSESTGLESIF